MTRTSKAALSLLLAPLAIGAAFVLVKYWFVWTPVAALLAAVLFIDSKR